MRIASTFAIPAEPGSIFDAFLDPSVMQRCIAGCEELERLSDSRYRGRLSNEVAHVRFRVGFDVEIVEMERPTLVRAVLSGEDRSLGSSLKLTATLGLQPDGEGSKVSYDMELAIWGKLGRLGEPIIRRRSAEVEREFVEAIRYHFDGSVRAEQPLTAAPAEGGSRRRAQDAAVESGGSTAVATEPAQARTRAGQRPASPPGRSRLAGYLRAALVALLRRLQQSLDVLIGKLE